MPEVHKDLGITNEVFDKACDIFTASAKKFRTNIKVLRQFTRRISGLRDQIVFPMREPNPAQ